MKAKILVILLSLFSLNLGAYAQEPASKPPASTAEPASKKININLADVTTLTGSFKGIGKKRAEAIIAYRDQHNGFKSLEELADVKGFGPNFVKKNKEQLQAVFVLQ